MTSAIDTLRQVNFSLARSKTAVASDAVVNRETAYFKANIGSIKTAKDLVANTRLLNYAMTAYGLGDMSYAKAFMQRLMEGGLSKSESLANNLSDKRFRAFVSAFNFGDLGSAATAVSTVVPVTTEKYVQQTLEDRVGQQNSGAQLALYFQRRAPEITSGLQILADKALLKFAQTTFDLPVSSATSVDTDLRALEKRLDVADLQDPAKVSKLVSRFAAKWDLQNSDVASNPLLALMGSQTQTAFGPSLLSSIQRLYTRF